MHSFLPEFAAKLSVPLGLSILLDTCAKAQGKQELWQNKKAAVLRSLKEQAVVSSTESSNRIEGVQVDADRLQPLVKGTKTPRTRSEEEIVGYRNALHWIHTKYTEIEIDPSTIKELHRLAQEGSIEDAGKWKTKNNEIIEVLPDGTRRVRFIPTQAEKVPEYIKNLCLAYKDAIKNNLFPELLLIATFIFDFLCIHPFRDGNGRVSRLLTLLLLYKANYTLGSYISLERIVEETKDDYYSSLRASSVAWQSAQHDLLPFWYYFIRTVKVGHERLQETLNVEESFIGGKTQLLRTEIFNQTTTFQITDILNKLPHISRELAQKVLSSLKKEGKLKLIGKGRGAKWKIMR